MKIIYLGDLTNSDDGNMDFFVEIDGLCYSFVAFTPKNILKLFETEYSHENHWVVDGLVVVKFLSEECISDAVDSILEKGIEKYGILQDD